jgi:hypothetical protein
VPHFVVSLHAQLCHSLAASRPIDGTENMIIPFIASMKLLQPCRDTCRMWASEVLLLQPPTANLPGVDHLLP